MAQRKRLTIKDMRAIATARGGKCLSRDYINKNTKLIWECAEGHRWEATPGNVKNRGSWCMKCSAKRRAAPRKRTIEEMHVLASKRGGKCLSDVYVDNSTNLIWECAEGHQWEMKSAAIKHAGQWCPECASGVSERVCRKYFELLFKCKFNKKRPVWLTVGKLSRLELDGYAEKIKVAFEYQGRQHYEEVSHFEHDLDQRQNYDQIKRDKCLEKGVALIEIPHTVSFEQMETFIRSECKKIDIVVPRAEPIRDEEVVDAYLTQTTFLDELQEIAMAKGGRLLPNQGYVNNSTKLWFECFEGHRWEAAPLKIKTGRWCRKCADMDGAKQKMKGIDDLIEIATKHGGRCISKTYAGNSSKLKWECAEGHQWEAVPKTIRRGHWCPDCGGMAKGSIDEMHELAAQKGGKCLSEVYKGNKTNLEWECASGHRWLAAPQSIKNKGTWCRKCIASEKSKKAWETRRRAVTQNKL